MGLHIMRSLYTNFLNDFYLAHLPETLKLG